MKPYATVLGALLLAGCAVGPDYHRPEVDVGAQYRGSLAAAEAHSIANIPWWELFGDERLRELIREALANNLDLKIAAARVLEAEAALGVTRADLFPNVAAAVQTQPVPRQPGDQLTSNFLGGTSLSWEIDVWGRFRRSTEAARAQLLATEEGRRAVITSLVADTASLYLQLNNLLELLTITQQTIDAERESLRLVERRAHGGVASAAEALQAKNQLASTEVQVPVLQRSLAQTQNALAFLLGVPPRAIEVPANKPVLSVPPDIPAGLPSELIDRRPDIRAAEANLSAANAQIGGAKSLFCPSITLPGFYGRQSTSLSDVVNGGAAVVSSLGVDILQPIFQGGRLLSSYRQARAQAERLALTYRQTILQALREVSDALVSYDRRRAEIDGDRSRVDTARELLRLTEMRYNSGVVSYLEVLDSQVRLYSAQVDLANAEFNQRIDVVQLYKALGGGWNPPAEPSAGRKAAAPVADGESSGGGVRP